MTEKNTVNGKNIAEILKDSLMVVLTLIFVLLYIAAFTGKFDPLKGNTMLLYLEPIIFILIGYYFGRLPSQQNEQSLKNEIVRQTQKADAAQYTKEKAQQEKETLEERVKNAKTVLVSSARMDKRADPDDHNQNSSISLNAAIRILDS